ncbi:glycoside hydrolase superfamily [Dactylonectria macrodidyma]|uniref:Glycoside hydrolase superfamily n=1 Tax=Dactylonectria macrodidyma TaxID=307937 RepID=A0A9P9ES65_9HYPO|nr:glycoside hydrolase superfamily [Dactylonectria macrodidyma]
MRVASILSCATLVAGAVIPGGSLDERGASGTIEKRASGTATVDLSVTQGTPQALGDGFIYGFPDNTDGSANTAIPSNLRTGSGFNYCRAGGAQLPSPSLGYASGQLQGRLMSFLSNYRTCRASGARFQLLVHDLWGADSVQSSTFKYPGDNGNWDSLDDFLTQVIAFIKNNNMQAGLELDLWNEPDSTLFWNADYQQYLNTWTRMYNRFKSELSSLPVTGPSISVPPSTSNTAWTRWLDHVKSTNTVPDIYTYHILGLEFTVSGSQTTLKSMLSSRGLSYKKTIVNEYGATAGGDQTNAGSVWYLANFERENIGGLRAHWGMGESNLHNGMAGLVNAAGSSYVPAAQWWVYNYYSKSMTGNRVSTTASADGVFEVFATRGSSKDSVKLITGLRPQYGVRTYDVTIKGLSAVGVTGGTVKVRTKRFNHVDWYLEGPAPTDLGVAEHTVTNGQITFWVTPDNQYTAYAFEFVN